MKTDDPKFTAHAIGELDDLTPAEIAEVEALLTSDASAAAEAAEMQTLAARLRSELQTVETHALTTVQRAKVLAAAEAASCQKNRKAASLSRRGWLMSFAAACMIVGLCVWMAQLAMQRNSTPYSGAASQSSSSYEVPLPDAEPLEAPSSPMTDPAHDFNFTSPTPDIAKTTPQINAYALTPPIPTNGIVKLPSTVAQSSGVHGYAMGIPGTMSGRFGPSSQNREVLSRDPYNVAANKGPREYARRYSRAQAAEDAKQGLAEWQVDSEWSQPYRRFDPKVVNIEPSKKTVEFGPGNTAAFDAVADNPFLTVREQPLSTFSTDVDTASYAIIRRFLNDRQLPPKGAVRIEELLNYFHYDYPQPKGDAPFSATMEVATCPWTPAHRLVRIGLKGREVARDRRPASNLVFLLDVSGSMDAPNRLPLLKQSLGLLIDQLGEEDRVAIVVYAGSSGCVLESTRDKAEMRAALGRLSAGGSTNGGEGIQLAYKIARKNFIRGGVNRVILGTDGDWNVGITSHDALFDLIKKEAGSGVFLTVFGFGMDNLKDAMLVKLADKGNGSYGYIDTLLEAKKLLVEQLSGTLVTIAKDVKIQVEFNPAQVAGYRLIGYEKRLLAKEDFNDDKKDAGEIGAGHTVTALYEIVPAGKLLPAPSVDAFKYQPAPPAEKPATSDRQPATSNELLTLKLRYKAPDGDTSKLLEFPLADSGATLEKTTRDFRFAAAVASYGMLLRDSPHKGNSTWDSVREIAAEARGEDRNGYRAEFISLLEKAKALSPQ